MISDETALKNALSDGVVLLAVAQNTTADAIGAAAPSGSSVSVVTLTRVRVVWTFYAWFSYVSSIPVALIAGATVGALLACGLIVGGVMIGLRVRARSKISPSTEYKVDKNTGLVIAVESQSPRRKASDARAEKMLASALKGSTTSSARRATVVPLDAGNPTARSVDVSATTARSEVPLVSSEDEFNTDGSVTASGTDAEMTSRSTRKKSRAPLPPLRPARAQHPPGTADSSETAGGSDNAGHDALSTEISALNAVANADRARRVAINANARSALVSGRAPLGGGAVSALKRASVGLRAAGANLLDIGDASAATAGASPKLPQETPPKRMGLNLASLGIPPPQEGGVKSLLGAGPGKLSAVERLKLRAARGGTGGSSK